MMKTALRRSLAVAISLSLVCPQGLAVRARAAEAVATMDGLSVGDDAVTVKLSTAASSNAFLTAKPPRLVVEFFDTQNQVGARDVAGKGKYLKRVRVAQYQLSPRKISRLVMDLNEMAGYRLVESGGSLVIQLVGDSGDAPAAGLPGYAGGEAEAASAPVLAAASPKDGGAKPKIIPKAEAGLEDQSGEARGEVSQEPAVSAPAKPAKARPAPKRGPQAEEVSAPAAAAGAKRGARSDIMGRMSKDLVTLDFDNTDVRDVLKLLAAKAKVNVIHGNDIGSIPPLTLHLADVPFNEAMQTILSMTGLVTAQVGDNILRVLTPGQLAKERSAATTFTKVIALNYSKAAEIQAAINSVRSAEGRSGTTTADQKTNSLIVTESLDGMAATERLIAQLDVRPKQVLIEAKLVEVSLGNSLHYGIQWDYLQVDRGHIGGQLGQNMIGSVANPAAANSPLLAPLNQNANAVAGVGAAGRGTGVNLPASTIFGALTLGRITNNYYLSATLTAAASQGKVKVLSDPKIATLNNQAANINVTTQYPYVTSSVSSTGVATQAVSYTITGIKLTVTPTINADGRITLDINPDVSQPSAAPSGAGTTGAIAVDARTAKTTVLVKDGETIVIGGLISDSVSNIVSKVPILGDIPILGWLFRKKSVVRNRSELLIFVTPKILPD